MGMFHNERVQGFLHADGIRLVNGAGEEIIPRGWGAGNWMNPEGFMVGLTRDYMGHSMDPGCALPGRFQSARTMTQTVRELCGSGYVKPFWKKWRENQLTEADIKAMADLGYNSVRLCLTAWALLPEEPGLAFDEDGFAELERVIALCEKYRVYAIIDMHGAPGGQSGLACDDGIDNIPHMFTEPESRERALALWEEIARRYADREIVGGYDLLNEPISIARWHHLIPELARFYDDCIARIRKHDKNHVVFLEGPMFSTNMRPFNRQFDPECGNWALAIHLYGYSPEIRDLYKFIAVRDKLNVPVWIGEGRSKDADMAVFYETAAQVHMGFNLWAWKSCKNDQNTGGVQYDLPEGFDAITDYAINGGPRPDYARAKEILDNMLDNMRYEKCFVNTLSHVYCQRRQGITLPGAGYDWRKGAFSANWDMGNALKFRTEDHTRLEMRPGVELFGENFIPGPPTETNDPLRDLYLVLEAGEYAEYTVRDVVTDCPVKAALAADGASVAEISCGDVSKTVSVPASEVAADFDTITLTPAEAHTVRIRCVSGRIKIASITFGPVIG